MGHPADGVLRRLLDEPSGVATLDREHVAGCERCGRLVEAIREDADVVRTALATDGGGARAAGLEVDRAWRRLEAAGPAPAPGRRAARVGRPRAAVRRPAVATVAVAMVLAGAGAVAANDWLPIFRTEKIVPLSLSTSDLNALPDLQQYGEVTFGDEPDVHEVPSAAAATAQTGLAVPEVTSLPRGVTGQPAYQAGGQATVTFTFSLARAAQASGGVGNRVPAPPPGLDGSSVRLEAGPGVAALWSKSGIPVLVVGRAQAPRAFSNSGVPFEALRDYLLSLPGLPPNVAASLRSFNADGSTLPLPVPADQVITSSAVVNGEPATVLATRDRAMAGVLWVKDGVVTIVAGTLDSDEVLAVARGLR